MKVLTDRTAAELVRLLRGRPALPSRPVRIAHGGGGERRGPFFLECRTFASTDAKTGDPVRVLRVFIGPSGLYPASIRINGKPAPLDISPSDVDSAGWLELGPVDGISAVWLVPKELPRRSPQTYYGATNWSSVAIRFRFDVDGNESAPGRAPTGAPDWDWPRWLHPLFVCRVDAGNIVQGVVGGADISVEVGDADGTHSGGATAGPGDAGGFCSIEQTSARQLQLYGFDAPNILVDPDWDGTLAGSFVLRLGAADGSDPAKIGYIDWSTLRDYLRRDLGFDIDSWLDSNITVLAGAIVDVLLDGDNDFWWRQGDDSSTCYGTEIGNAKNSPVIDLSSLILLGTWKTDNNFSVGDANHAAHIAVHGNADIDGSVTAQGSGNFTGSLNTASDLAVTGDATLRGNLTVFLDISGTVITGSQIVSNDSINAATDVTAGRDLAVTGDASVGGDLAVTGDASVGGDISATGELSGATLKVGGNVYAPAQITYMDGNGTPQTITVLKKQ